ncbi:16792_t:CDS:2, partial [Acaulospora colombiana]
YSALKKYIFQLEKQFHETDSALNDLEASHERSRLISSNRHAAGLKAADTIFSGLLDKELDKIILFYAEQEADLKKDIEMLERDIVIKTAEGSTSRIRPNRTSSPNDRRTSTSDYGEMGMSLASTTRLSRIGNSPEATRRRRRTISNDMGPKRKSALLEIIDRVVPGRDSFSGSAGPEDVWNSETNYARDVRMVFQRRITTLYNTANSLKSYVELNHSGFRKILKKYDKVLDSEISSSKVNTSMKRWRPPIPGYLKPRPAWIHGLQTSPTITLGASPVVTFKRLKRSSRSTNANT